MEQKMMQDEIFVRFSRLFSSKRGDYALVQCDRKQVQREPIFGQVLPCVCFFINL